VKNAKVIPKIYYGPKRRGSIARISLVEVERCRFLPLGEQT